jgi:hypothetical protein
MGNNPGPVGQVLTWEEDPGSGKEPVPVPVPALDTAPLAMAIQGVAPQPQIYDLGTPEFRYWAAAAALRRGAAFWSALLQPGVTWEPGAPLAVILDEGEDLNAFYDRQALNFFHGAVGGGTVFSGESPDILCHEMGHAVLDAVRPELFDAPFIEAAAFHESFGDMSAILSDLQTPSLRQSVLEETQGHLERSSRLSRLAEQLGAAIRQTRPDSVDPDCLRNAVNSFFYVDPNTLQPLAPASSLSSEPHSFSRVFTGGFYGAFAGMVVVQAGANAPSADDMAQVSQDMGRILLDAIAAAPLVPQFFSQVAAHMVEADAARFGGKYGDALKSAFVRHGILSLQSAAALAQPALAVAPVRAAMAGAAEPIQPSRFSLQGADFGLDAQVLQVPAVVETRRFAVTGAGAGPMLSHDDAAHSFVEDLFQRGNVHVDSASAVKAAATHPLGRKTHKLVKEGTAVVLVRQYFDCGFRGA